MKSNPNSLALGIALAGLAIISSLAVRVHAQTVNCLTDFNGHNGYLPLSSVRGSKRSDDRHGFCGHSGWNAQQQPAVCGDEVDVTAHPCAASAGHFRRTFQ